MCGPGARRPRKGERGIGGQGGGVRGTAGAKACAERAEGAEGEQPGGDRSRRAGGRRAKRAEGAEGTTGAGTGPAQKPPAGARRTDSTEKTPTQVQRTHPSPCTHRAPSAPRSRRAAAAPTCVRVSAESATFATPNFSKSAGSSPRSSAKTSACGGKAQATSVSACSASFARPAEIAPPRWPVLPPALPLPLPLPVAVTVLVARVFVEMAARAATGAAGAMELSRMVAAEAAEAPVVSTVAASSSSSMSAGGGVGGARSSPTPPPEPLPAVPSGRTMGSSRSLVSTAAPPSARKAAWRAWISVVVRCSPPTPYRASASTRRRRSGRIGASDPPRSRRCAPASSIAVRSEARRSDPLPRRASSRGGSDAAARPPRHGAATPWRIESSAWRSTRCTEAGARGRRGRFAESSGGGSGIPAARCSGHAVGRCSTCSIDSIFGRTGGGGPRRISVDRLTE